MDNGFPVTFDVLEAALSSVPIGVVITDNGLPDNPIVYCNAKLHELSGYAENEIIGRNCRFLQGEGSDQSTLKNTLAAGTLFQGELLNYKKDGTPFWNELSVSPIRNESDQITHFIGFQNDVTRRCSRCSKTC